jgi:hypothetical protein
LLNSPAICEQTVICTSLVVKLETNEFLDSKVFDHLQSTFHEGIDLKSVQERDKLVFLDGLSIQHLLKVETEPVGDHLKLDCEFQLLLVTLIPAVLDETLRLFAQILIRD